MTNGLEASSAIWLGVATFTLDTSAARTLKQKRGLVTPVVERLRQRYPVSVARLDDVDRLGSERIGLVVMNRDPSVCRSVLERALAFAASLGPSVEGAHVEIERWD